MNPRLNKLFLIDSLPAIINPLKEQNQTIVHCHGVFDLLHIGHIRHLEQASQMGDVLVVTITPDRFVDKGLYRPAFNENLRAETIASLNCVDYVAINKWPTAETTLRTIRPDFYVKGAEFKNRLSDMTGKIGLEEKAAREIGTKIAFTEDIVFSSTNLINRHLSNLPEDIDKYMKVFRERFHLDELIDILDKMATMNVLIIGDTIIDEYQYCETIGKSSKDPALAMHYQSHDIFAGGVLAIANHVSNFANSVKLITVLGENNSFEHFIRSQLNQSITPYFIFKKNTHTLIKRRFIDGYTFNKLFEVYVMDDSHLPDDQDTHLCSIIQEDLKSYDIVISADFGHGMISPNMIRTLSDYSRFLSVNTQANAGNRGFNTISRYPRADYACIAEHEIRLESRTRNGSLKPLMSSIAKSLKCSRFAVTRGRKGCTITDGEMSYIEVPAFARKIVDRVGAGDAFFSVTSLAAALGVPNEAIGFIGNVVGALAVEIPGNKKSIDKLSVKKYITSLAK